MAQKINFYILNHSTKISVIGHYPQTLPHEGYNPLGDNGIYHVRVNRFPDFNPAYKVRLHPLAVPTDFLIDYGLPSGMLVSPKVKECLTSVNLPLHNFYEVEVYRGNEILQYYWLFIVFNMWDYLVFEESVYTVKNISSGKIIERIKPANKEQFLATMKQHSVDSTIQWEKICFQPKVEALDLITFGAQLHYTAISDKVVSLLESAKLSGYEISPTDLIFIRHVSP